MNTDIKVVYKGTTYRARLLDSRVFLSADYTTVKDPSVIEAVLKKART